MRTFAYCSLTVLAFAAACDPLGPDSESAENESSRPTYTVLSDPAQYAVRFFEYSENEDLRSADWTAIVRHPGAPILGDWRARSVAGAFSGVAAVLTDPPTEEGDRRALRWDSLPSLGPPVEILTRFWLPPSSPPSSENARIGVAWFIQDPDSTGKLNAMALVRNFNVEDGFAVFRMVANTVTGVWTGPGNDGFDDGGWTWVRIQHQINTSEGTVRYRVWQGDLADEPSTWTAEVTSTWFGPDGGPYGPGITGGAGLFTNGDATMAGDSVVWGVFTIGTGGLPAPPPTQEDTTQFRIVSLTCPAVVRTDTVDCAATWEPDTIAASEILFKWTFFGDTVRVFPDPTAAHFGAPAPIDTTAVGLDHWIGMAVHSGEVFLRAVWQADTVSATTSLVVNPRTGGLWDSLRVSVDTVSVKDDSVTFKYYRFAADMTKSITQQPSPIPGSTLLGLVGLNLDSIAGFSGLEETIRGVPDVPVVPSGPNRGLGYVADPGDVRVTRVIALRTLLTGNEDPRFLYTCVPGDTMTIRGLLHAMRQNSGCNGPRKFRTDSTDWRMGVWGHELFGANGGKGHQGEFHVAGKSVPTCGNAPAILERVIAPGAIEALAIAGDVLNEARKSLRAAADHDRVLGNFSVAPTYEVESQVITVTNTTPSFTVDDTQKPPQPGNEPDPNFKCTRNF